MIYLSAHLPTDGSDARPALQALLDAHPGETFVVDMEARLRSETSRGKVVRLAHAGTSMVGTGALINEAIGADVASRRVIAGMPGADGLTFRDFAIESHTPDPSGQSALFHFSNGEQGVTIEGVRMLRNEGGDAAYFGTGCDGFRVEDCIVRDFWRHGLVSAGYGADRAGFIFRNNDVGETAGWHRPGRPSIKIETKDPAAVNAGVRIVGNRCSGQIQTAQARGAVTGNLCASMAHTRTRGLLVAHNVIRYTGAAGWALHLVRDQEAHIADNVIDTDSNGMVVERYTTGGVEWETVHPGAALTGEGNRVLMRDPSRVAFLRYNGRAPRDAMTDPDVWVRP